jgi:hypothetical protein
MHESVCKFFMRAFRPPLTLFDDGEPHYRLARKRSILQFRQYEKRFFGCLNDSAGE